MGHLDGSSCHLVGHPVTWMGDPSPGGGHLDAGEATLEAKHLATSPGDHRRKEHERRQSAQGWTKSCDSQIIT